MPIKGTGSGPTTSPYQEKLETIDRAKLKQLKIVPPPKVIKRTKPSFKRHLTTQNARVGDKSNAPNQRLRDILPPKTPGSGTNKTQRTRVYENLCRPEPQGRGQIKRSKPAFKTYSTTTNTRIGDK